MPKKSYSDTYGMGKQVYGSEIADGQAIHIPTSYRYEGYQEPERVPASDSMGQLSGGIKQGFQQGGGRSLWEILSGLWK